ncbi:hypothetical protein IWW57_001810 [Coemansia sp. S610]|nr:hypothetical protein IWW57_001810 [Coemansia sp. S610]
MPLAKQGLKHPEVALLRCAGYAQYLDNRRKKLAKDIGKCMDYTLIHLLASKDSAVWGSIRSPFKSCAWPAVCPGARRASSAERLTLTPPQPTPQTSL